MPEGYIENYIGSKKIAGLSFWAKGYCASAVGPYEKTIKNINQSPLSDERFPVDLFEQRYKDKFALYTEDNIKNCTSLLVKEPKNCNLSYDKQRGVCFDFLRHLKNS